MNSMTKLVGFVINQSVPTAQQSQSKDHQARTSRSILSYLSPLPQFDQTKYFVRGWVMAWTSKERTEQFNYSHIVKI